MIIEQRGISLKQEERIRKKGLKLITCLNVTKIEPWFRIAVSVRYEYRLNGEGVLL